jgi:hypothetical protein
MMVIDLLLFLTRRQFTLGEFYIQPVLKLKFNRGSSRILWGQL